MTWFRLYHDLVDDPKVQRLPGETFKFWINVLCLASQSREEGFIDLDVEDIAWRTRMSESEARGHLDALIDAGLVDRDEEDSESLWIHNWLGRQGGEA